MPRRKPGTCPQCGQPMWGKGVLPCRKCVGIGSRQPRSCEICSVVYKPTHTEQRTCGRECGAKVKPLRQRSVVGSQIELHFCGICQGLCLNKKCSVECADAAKLRTASASYLRRRNAMRRPIACVVCGAEWCKISDGAGSGKRTCSDECAVQLKRRKPDVGKNDRQRARHFGVAYEPIRRERVYERDEWVCGLCARPVDRRLSGHEPWGATLDHRQTMSLGGPHLYDNVQLAHRRCNEDKGARLVRQAPRPVSVCLPDGFLHVVVGWNEVGDVPTPDLTVSLWRSAPSGTRLITRRAWSLKGGWGVKIADG